MADAHLTGKPLQRDHAGARARLLAYRLTWGRTGMMLSNVVVIGSLVIVQLHLGIL